jgi:hypothetical protein
LAMDVRGRRETERSDQRDVAGPRRGACLGHYPAPRARRPPRTLDLGDARLRLPRLRPTQAREGGRELV